MIYVITYYKKMSNLTLPKRRNLFARNQWLHLSVPKIGGLFHYISTNAKYPRLKNVYKMLIDHLHRIVQAIFKKNLKSDCPLMRYRKSPLHVRREYVKIQKLILRPLLMAERWFLCQNICFEGWGIYIWGLNKANFAIKLCFDSFFRF